MVMVDSMLKLTILQNTQKIQSTTKSPWWVRSNGILNTLHTSVTHYSVHSDAADRTVISNN